MSIDEQAASAVKEKPAAAKQTFSGSVGFILACIGSAVGLGNIWRFPVLISQFGGLTFLIPYLAFVVLITYTGVIEEYALGRASGKGPVGAFGWACKDKGYERVGRAIGILPMLGSFGLAVGYSVVLGWVLYYCYQAVSGHLLSFNNNLPGLEAAFNSIACAGGCNWGIIAATLFCVFIMGAGVASGIERANRVLLPALAVLFVLIIIYITTVPGANDGFKYIFTLEPQHLLNPKVWIFAFGQAFFSLSVTGNISVIFGSYLPKEDDIPRSAFFVALFDTLAAMLATLIIIPAMATTGTQLSSGGPGLMFIYLVDVFNRMPGGWLVQIMFFAGVSSAGITTLITIYEPGVALANKKLGMSRWLTTVVILAIGCVTAISIQSMTAQWMDILSIYICPMGALMAGVAFFWMQDKDKALQAVNEGSQHPVGEKFLWTGKYVYCLATLIALVAGIWLGGIG